MFLLHHQTEEEAGAAAELLRAMGGHARRLLEQCVESQGLTRKAVSGAARALHDAGFIFVRETGILGGDAEFTLTPALAGEEALEALEVVEQGA